MSRHGGSVHFVRPDRIVRTGVLSPIVGYQPQSDVMHVTREFTSGPASGMQLAGYGLGESPIVGWFKRVGYRIKAEFARKRAEKMMLTNGASAMAQTAIMAAGPAAPAIAHVQGASAQIHAMQDMARFLTQRGPAPMRGEIFPQRRWNTYFFAG